MLCNDSAIADGKEIGDPTETALINLGIKLGESYDDARKRMPRIGEIPFDSDRKLMSTLNEYDDGKSADGKVRMITKGAVDVLLGRVEQCTIFGGSFN